MAGSRRPGETFVPFNLSTLAPFESTAAAVAELPLLHSFQPSATLDTSPFVENKRSPTNETIRTIVDMMAENTTQDAWCFSTEDIDVDEADIPSWVTKTSNSLNSQLGSAMEHRTPRRTTKRPRHDGSNSNTPKGATTPSSSRLRRFSKTAKFANGDVSHARASAVKRNIEEDEYFLEEGGPDEEDDENQRLREDLGDRACNELDDKNVKRFINFIQRFVGRTGDNPSESLQDVLRMTENEKRVEELHDKLSVYADKTYLHRVPPALLANLVNALAARVRHTVGALQNESKKDLDSSFLSSSRLSAHCVNIIFRIYSSPNIDNTVILEEVVEISVHFMEVVSNSLIYPCFLSSKKSSKDADEDDEDSVWGISGSSKATQKLVTAVSNIFELFISLVFNRQATEELVLQSLSAGIRSLRIPDLGLLHSSVSKLAAAVYSSFPSLQGQVLNFVVDEIGFIPANRRQLRTFRVSGTTTSSVRVPSAMALMVIQYAAGGKKPRIQVEDLDEDDALSSYNGFNAASVFAANMADRLLKRMAEEADTEYRLAIASLLEDILKLYVEPEWPSACLFVRTVCFGIIKMLEDKTMQKRTSSFSRSWIVEFLGKLSNRISELFGSKLLTTTDPVRSFETSDAEVVVLQYVKEGSSSSAQEKSASALWHAIFTAKDIQTVKEQERQDSDDQSVEQEDVGNKIRDEQEVIQKCFADRMKKLSQAMRSGDTPNRAACVNAVGTVLLSTSLIKDFRRLLDTAVYCSIHDPSPRVRSKAIRTLCRLGLDGRLLVKQLPIFQGMEDCCRDVSTLVREAATEFIGQFLNVGKKGVTVCSNAQSNSKDDDDQVIAYEHVYDLVSRRLKDSSTAVRKKAISIFRNRIVEILSQKDAEYDMSVVDACFALSDDENELLAMCISIVGRLDDPEATVRSIAEISLREALFSIDSKNEVKLASYEAYASKCARRLVFLFLRSRTSNLFARILGEKTLSVHRKLISGVVTTVVNTFHDIENRMESEKSVKEKISNETSTTYSMYEQLRVACSSVLLGICLKDSTLIAPHCMSFSSMFNEYRPTSKLDIVCTSRILKLFELGVPVATDIDTETLVTTFKDLEQMTCNIGVAELEEPIIRCLCVVAARLLKEKNGLEESTSVMFSLGETFCSYLVENEKNFLALGCGEKMEDASLLARNGRGALVRLSLLLRYGNYRQDFVKAGFETLYGICSGLLDGWEKAESTHPLAPVLLRAAVKGLIYFLIQHRDYLPVGTKVIVRSWSTALYRLSKFGNERESAELLVQVLMGFHEMLRNEEERNADPLGEKEKTTEGNQREANGVRSCNRVGGTNLAAEDDAEAVHLADSAQELLPLLATTLSSRNPSIRRYIVSIYGLLTRQGLVLPAKIVSPLFTLLTDPDSNIRDDAHRVLAFIAERFSQMLASATIPAIRDCYERTVEYLKAEKIDGDPVQMMKTSLVDEKTGLCIFSSVFLMLNRDQRLGILEALLREFDPCLVTRPKVGNIDDGEEFESGDEELVPLQTNDTSEVRPVSMLVYIAILVAHLDYTLGAGGGGTSAADTKLRAGRAEIAEICSMATRIASNSGQAVYRVGVQELRSEKETTTLGKVADYASRLAVLLQLKSFLCSLKPGSTQKTVNEDEDEEQDKSPAPSISTFRISGMKLTSGPLSGDVLLLLPSKADQMKQLKQFKKLMQKDSTDLVGSVEDEEPNGSSNKMVKRRRGRRKMR